MSSPTAKFGGADRANAVVSVSSGTPTAGQVAQFTGTGNQVVPAAGGGTFPGVDVWASQGSPGSVTDWGPIINTLISGGATRLYFGKHDFPFSTQLNLANTQGIVFAGAGGAQGMVIASTPPTRLIWKGTGSGSPITLAGNNGFYGCDFGWFYDSNSFTGRLWDNNTAYATVLERCRIGSLNYRFSALACVAMGQAVNCTLRDCAIGGDGPGTAQIGGGQYCVSGYESGFSNVIALDNCILGRATTAQASNPYQQWVFDNVTWELFDTPRAILSNLGITGDFQVRGGWVGDSTASTEPFSYSATDVWHASFKGLWGGLTAIPFFKLLGAGSISIEDCPLTRSDSGAIVDLGDTGAGAVQKDVYIRGGNWITNVDPILHRSGHRLTIQGMGESCKTVEKINVTGHENIGWKASDPCVPTITALAALGASPSVTIRGSDRAGLFYMTPGAGNTAGQQATITFGSAYEQDPLNSQTISYGADIPLMEIWPIDWGGIGMANAFAAQAAPFYASNSKTAVVIKTNNALAGIAVWGYRVIEI